MPSLLDILAPVTPADLGRMASPGQHARGRRLASEEAVRSFSWAEPGRCLIAVVNDSGPRGVLVERRRGAFRTRCDCALSRTLKGPCSHGVAAVLTVTRLLAGREFASLLGSLRAKLYEQLREGAAGESGARARVVVEARGTSAVWLALDRADGAFHPVDPAVEAFTGQGADPAVRIQAFLEWFEHGHPEPPLSVAVRRGHRTEAVRPGLVRCRAETEAVLTPEGGVALRKRVLLPDGSEPIRFQPIGSDLILLPEERRLAFAPTPVSWGWITRLVRERDPFIETMPDHVTVEAARFNALGVREDELD